jgi:hypothetical protein
MKLKTIRKFFLVLLIIISIKFFTSKIIVGTVWENISWFFLFFILIISLPSVKFKKTGFSIPVLLISFSIFFSIFMADYSWSQSYFDSIKATVPYLIWFYFFYLIKHNIPISFIEKVIVFYGLLYMLLFFFQFVNSDNIMFGWGEEYDNSRGVTRIVFPGGGVLYFSLFMSLNKLTTTKSYRYFWLTFLLVGIIVVIMQMTTQLIFAVVIIFSYHILKNNKWDIKILKIVGIICVCLLVVNTNNVLSNGLKAANEEHLEDGEENIRILSGTYFLTEFSPTNLSRIFGNGIPYGDSTPYGRPVINLQQELSFHLSDVGLTAVYAMYGIIGVLGFILIWIKSFTIPLPKNYYYLKYYLWLLLITCLTSDYIYNYNFLITNVLVLYCYHNVYIRELNKAPLIKKISILKMT